MKKFLAVLCAFVLCMGAFGGCTRGDTPDEKGPPEKPIDPVTYTVTYELNGGTNSAANPAQITEGSSITLSKPTKTGHTFLGWYTSSDFAESSKVTQITGTQNWTLYAQFRDDTPPEPEKPDSYTVTYVLDGGTNSVANPAAVAAGATLTLAKASKAGHTFLGWYTSSDFAESSKVTQIAGTQNWTLYAKFKSTAPQSYSVTYVLDGGVNASDNPATVSSGQTVTLKNATKTGHTFLGWYTGSDFAESGKVTKITGTQNWTLYAKFQADSQPEEPQIYTVTYELDGGANSSRNPAIIVEGGSATLQSASKAGHTFIGWYTSSDFAESGKVTKITGTQNWTLYAKFREITYTVTYVLYGGVNAPANLAQIREGDSLILANPTKEGYTFLGWYASPDFAEASKTVSVSGIGDITLYAKFEATITNDTYGSFWMRNHSYKTMPVTAFNACPPLTKSSSSEYTYDYLAHEQTFIDYAEAGVNTMMGLYEGGKTEATLQALDWCEKYDLSYLISVSGAAANITNASLFNTSIQPYKTHPAFGGLMQCDEPGRVWYEQLRDSKAILDSLMPASTKGALWHCNLFPTYAADWQLYHRASTPTAIPEEVGGAYTYEQYVKDYMDIYKPQVLSYDYYPLKANFPDLSNGWFKQIEIIRRHAAGANVPFWVYILTCKYSGGTRIPACAADVLWQVNTALTMGAKGIQYFTGVVALNGGGESFEGAMFDRAGNKTAVYDYVKLADSQLAAVDEVLMCARNKGVMQIGSSANGENIDASMLLNSYGPLTGAVGAHSLIGCFEYGKGQAYYITNNSLTETETLTLRFNESVNGYTVQKTAKASFAASEKALTLEPGEGVLVVVE